MKNYNGINRIVQMNRYYADCFYIVPNKIPIGWKKFPVIHTKTNETMRDLEIKKESIGI